MYELIKKRKKNWILIVTSMDPKFIREPLVMVNLNCNLDKLFCLAVNFDDLLLFDASNLDISMLPLLLSLPSPGDFDAMPTTVDLGFES